MKELWDKKSKNFPKYNKDSKEDQPIFDFFSAQGVELNDKVVLDLGCGNGRYALHIAQHARLVYALDISSEMIENPQVNFNIKSADMSTISQLFVKD